MVFSSIIFLFYFMPLVLGAYLLGWFSLRPWPRVRLRVANLFLVGSSLFFYAWGEQWIVLVMLTSVAVDYVCGRMIHAGRARRPALVASIVANLALLGFFKYFGFGVDNLNAAARALGLEALVWDDALRVSLPLGISFYTFQSMSYTIDVYRGRVPATRNLLDFACFVTMFPQLVAGPIVRYRDMADQLIRRTIDFGGFAEGVRRFVIGLGKKVLIANTVAEVADRVFALPAPELSPGLAWLGVLCYTLQIYFDFSGYSDMAIGLGRMLGFTFPENFRWPYGATSIQDFWRRWHISLSTWFRDYLYIPLGGSRRGSRRTYLNLALVFLLCGLWHGASWSFIAWGGFHGAFLVLERRGVAAWLWRMPAPVRHAYVLLVVMVGWVLFRAASLGAAGAFLGAMSGLATGAGVQLGVRELLGPELVMAIVVGTVFSLPVAPWLRARVEELGAHSRAGGVLVAASEGSAVLGLVVVLVLSCLWISSGSYNPFLYFRF